MLNIFYLIRHYIYSISAALTALFLIFALLNLNGCLATSYMFIEAPTSSKYSIKGKMYYVKQFNRYEEVGIASWYGKPFHLRKTANGEIFNKNLISAAHKTLPIPCIVEVTNLENGKKIKVRVNDRGPFSGNRIIDLSEKAAEELNFKHQGVVKVKIKYLKSESDKLPKKNRHDLKK